MHVTVLHPWSSLNCRMHMCLPLHSAPGRGPLLFKLQPEASQQHLCILGLTRSHRFSTLSWVHLGTLRLARCRRCSARAPRAGVSLHPLRPLRIAGCKACSRGRWHCCRWLNRMIRKRRRGGGAGQPLLVFARCMLACQCGGAVAINYRRCRRPDSTRGMGEGIKRLAEQTNPRGSRWQLQNPCLLLLVLRLLAMSGQVPIRQAGKRRCGGGAMAAAPRLAACRSMPAA